MILGRLELMTSCSEVQCPNHLAMEISLGQGVFEKVFNKTRPRLELKLKKNHPQKILCSFCKANQLSWHICGIFPMNDMSNPCHTFFLLIFLQKQLSWKMSGLFSSELCVYSVSIMIVKILIKFCGHSATQTNWVEKWSGLFSSELCVFSVSIMFCKIICSFCAHSAAQTNWVENWNGIFPLNSVPILQQFCFLRFFANSVLILQHKTIAVKIEVFFSC